MITRKDLTPGTLLRWLPEEGRVSFTDETYQTITTGHLMYVAEQDEEGKTIMVHPALGRRSEWLFGDRDTGFKWFEVVEAPND